MIFTYLFICLGIKTISKIPHTRLSDIAVMPQFSFKMQTMAKNSPEVMQHSVIDMRCFWYVDGIKIFILSCTCMLIFILRRDFFTAELGVTHIRLMLPQQLHCTICARYFNNDDIQPIVLITCIKFHKMCVN